MSLEILFLKMVKLIAPYSKPLFSSSPEGLHKSYSIDLSENLTECCLDAFLRNNVAIFDIFKIYFVIIKNWLFLGKKFVLNFKSA